MAESNKSPIATIVIRGATENLMDDIERAIDDGVNAYKALTKVLTVLISITSVASFRHCDVCLEYKVELLCIVLLTSVVDSYMHC